MSHEILDNDRIGYVGETPWHGLGTPMLPGESLESWIEKIFPWKVVEEELLRASDGGAVTTIADRKALVRDDDDTLLSIVSNRFQAPQPQEVMMFFKDVVDKGQFTIETGGSLRGGRRIWALARTNQEARIKGNDPLREYVLLASAYDAMMSHWATRTSVRVVCANTLEFASGRDGEKADVRVPHNTEFNPGAIWERLGWDGEGWATFVEQAEALADRPVQRREVVDFFVNLFWGHVPEDKFNVEDKSVQRKLASVVDLFEHGRGQDTRSAANTAWGLVNCITLFTDHERPARSQDNRLNSAWFGPERGLKAKALSQALKLVA